MKKLLLKVAAVTGAIATFEYLRRKGVVDEVSGKVKEKFGEFTDDPEMKIKGVVQESGGKIKQFFHKSKDAIEESLEVSEDELN